MTIPVAYRTGCGNDDTRCGAECCESGVLLSRRRLDYGLLHETQTMCYPANILRVVLIPLIQRKYCSDGIGRQAASKGGSHQEGDTDYVLLHKSLCVAEIRSF